MSETDSSHLKFLSSNVWNNIRSPEFNSESVWPMISNVSDNKINCSCIFYYILF